MLNVRNEYGTLRKVLMASVETFRIHEPINGTQKFYYKNDPPKLEKLVAQQKEYIKVLKNNNVEILFAEKRDDSTNQINTRDVAFVIGNSFIVSPMKEKIRQNEHLGLNSIIRLFDSTDSVLRPQQGVIEGGDIVLSDDIIYVGISQRTNLLGVDWLKITFGDIYKIVPIYLNDGFLHLDVVFNILSNGVALVCKEGIKQESFKVIDKNFNVVFTDYKEQIYLPTNVFSINPKLVVVDPRHKRTNNNIYKSGVDIVEVDFSEISKIGGSFRCSTCPLVRE